MSQLLEIKDEVFALDVDKGATLCLEDYKDKKEEIRLSKLIMATTIGAARNLFPSEDE